jgi:DNA polymerase-3 subunit delta'
VITDTSTTSPESVFPWQAEQWRSLWRLRQREKLAHAMLFVGMDGIGKRHFAAAFAQAILCAQPGVSGDACNECHSCRMLAANLHPDLIWIEPEEADKKIAVDQIRDLIKSANETTLKGGYRVVIINPATSMNMNAANALLKTLEEPVANTLLILISNLSMRLPATILSRCQKLVFDRVAPALAYEWVKQKLSNTKVAPELLLQLAQGAPLRALALSENDDLTKRVEFYNGLQALHEGTLDPVALAAKWHADEQLMVLDLLLNFLTDLMRYKMTADVSFIVNADYQNQIMKISSKWPQAGLLAYLGDVQQTRNQVSGAINLNKQLMLEDIFIRWAHYVSG